MKSTIGAKIDAVYKLDLEIEKLERKARALKTIRGSKELQLLNLFKKEEVDKAVGRTANARRYEVQHPSIKNPKKFWKYVRQHNAFELVHKRVSAKAYFERLEEGEKVPGVEVFKEIRISITKRK